MIKKLLSFFIFKRFKSLFAIFSAYKAYKMWRNGNKDNDSRQSSEKTAQPGSYEKWTKEDLYQRAVDLDINGRSTMNKDELIKALRA